MGWTAWALPVVWAQSAGAGSATATSPAASVTATSNALAPLALRRWLGGVTLCSPESVPSLFGLWVWVAALGALLVTAAVFQGPRTALGQFFDLPGLVRLTASAARRVRRASRMVAAVIGTTVLAWTGSQSMAFNRPEARDDLILLTKSRGLAELAVEQGGFAALTPLRDVASLGSNLPLLIVAALVVLRVSTDAWGGPPLPGHRRKRPSGWSGPVWFGAALLTLYRLVSIGTGYGDLPLGGCLMVEPIVVPAVMALCDGLLLGWVIVELRDAGSDDSGASGLDPHAALGLMPGSILACLAALPARYLASGVLLASYSLPSTAATSAVGSSLRWLLGRGIADVQGAALLTAGLAGAVAWGGVGVGSAFRGYGRLLKAQGGRLTAALALGGGAAGVASAVAYAVVLSMPASTWILNAADSYAHYLSLPIGLWTLAALIELGERSLPKATLIPVECSEAAASLG